MATILDLLMALNRGDLPPLPAPAKPLPIPLAPVPNLGPLSEETTAAYGALNPEPVPPRFVQPAAPDMNFVNQETGAAPTAPAPLSRAQRIMNAIAGFGAGVQGQGAQFLSQLQEPQREYQRQLERYQGRRAQATELAERKAERQAEQENRALELTYQRDYNEWLSKNKDRSAEAKLRMQQAFTLKRDAAQAQLEEERAQRLERRQREDDARQIAGRLGTGPGAAPPEIAKELGKFYANLTDKLSPAAEKFRNAQARRAEILASRPVGGGGGENRISKQTAKLVEEFNVARNNLVTAIAGGQTGEAQKQIQMKLKSLVRRLTGRPGIEAGFGAGNWPYVKVNGQLSTGEPTAQPTAQGKTITRAEMQALGVTEAEVKAEGYTIIEQQ